jgi:hypothetical protein
MAWHAKFLDRECGRQWTGRKLDHNINRIQNREKHCPRNGGWLPHFIRLCGSCRHQHFDQHCKRWLKHRADMNMQLAMKTKLRSQFIRLAFLAGIHQAAAQNARFLRTAGPAPSRLMNPSH